MYESDDSHLIKTRILSKAHFPQSKISPQRAPFALFSIRKTPQNAPIGPGSRNRIIEGYLIN